MAYPPELPQMMEKINIVSIIRYIVRRLNVYSHPGLLLRIFLDLLVSNGGMLLGTLFTIIIWNDSPIIHRDYFKVMFFQTWLENIPLVTLSCLVGYIMTGLYGVTRENRLRKILLAVAQAVTTALFIYTLILYFNFAYIPRSMFFVGWFFVFVFIAMGRLGRRYFYVTYRIVPLANYNPRLEEIVRDLTMLSQQEGWVPPEGLPAKAAWPCFADDEVLAAAAVLRSGKVNQWTGREVVKFQEEFAASCGVKRAIALANGTVALELALRTFGIGPGDEVIVTPRTFIASASCAVLQGAKLVFADVDRESQNISAATIREVITPQTKAIIAVHLAGWPCDMDRIMELAAEHNIKVIEDCAQAHGAMYKGKPVGSFGHAAAFSFCQDKIMTTGGEGGMFLTDDEAVWAAAWSFKDHGKSYDSVFHRQHATGFRWLHDSFGTNWRMTEMQAAIGRVQLRKLPEWVNIRRRNAAILNDRLAGLDVVRLTLPPPEIYHSYYKYYIFVNPERLYKGWDRDRIMNSIIEEGVPCFSGSCSEIYLEKAFDGNGLRPVARLAVARELGETSLMFLVHPTLSETDMIKAADVVGKVLSKAGC